MVSHIAEAGPQRTGYSGGRPLLGDTSASAGALHLLGDFSGALKAKDAGWVCLSSPDAVAAARSRAFLDLLSQNCKLEIWQLQASGIDSFSMDRLQSYPLKKVLSPTRSVGDIVYTF